MHINNDWKEDFTKVYNHPIGQGSFGKVYLVKSNKSSQYFAMKEINLNQQILKSSIINRSYALDEGLKLRQLNIQHKNIIKYHKSYIHDESIFWIMEYCDAGTLRDKINLYTLSEKKFDENLIWYWSLQILSGIRYIHNKGIIHRDLKPDNVYIEGKHGTCKIGDFGFSKVLVESSLTENTTTKCMKLEETDELAVSKVVNSVNSKKIKKKRILNLEDDEEKIVYKFINLSQVGTPSYIAPELRMLIDSHLTFCSVDTINKSVKLCERNVYKSDIFSFGCILYELVFLKVAFENKFLLPHENFNKINVEIADINTYSNDMKFLIKRCLEIDPVERLNIREIFNLEIVKKRLNENLNDYYKFQIIPRLVINKKQNALEYIRAKLENNFRPVALKSLKYNQNLIIILAYKQFNNAAKSKNNFMYIAANKNLKNNDDTSKFENNESNFLNYEPDIDVDDDFEDMKIFVYNEFGQLLKEFSSFMCLSNKNDNEYFNEKNNSNQNRQQFNFKIYDFCVDEEYNHLYLSSKKFGILRFKILENNFYFEELLLEGRVDLSELCKMNYEEKKMYKCFPTCFSLIENEASFKDSAKVNGRRRLIFNDRCTNRLISIQIELKSSYENNKNDQLRDSLSDENFIKNANLIRCLINDGFTLDKQYGFARQLVSTKDELICLFDDLNIINVYSLKTLQFKRSNFSNINGESNFSYKNIKFCLAVDSDEYLYSTNGKSIFNIDLSNFKKFNKIKPSIKQGENLSHTISHIQILTNAKLVLLTDAIQMENSILFILKQVSR